jgi:hypothetical protein
MGSLKGRSISSMHVSEVKILRSKLTTDLMPSLSTSKPENGLLGAVKSQYTYKSPETLKLIQLI